MEIIHSIITLNLVFITIYSFGRFISDKIFKNHKTDFFFIVVIGYTFIGSISVILHFFFKIDDFISIITISLGLFIFFTNYSRLDKNEFYFFLIIISSFSFLFFGYSDHPIDTNMYHHPYVSYLKSEKIIIAIANIQFRFGHISFLQYVQAITTNSFLHSVSLASINIILYISLIYFLTLKIINTKYFNFNFVVTVLIGIFLLLKFARYREYGNDIIPLLLGIYFLIQILNVNKNNYFSQNNLFNFFFPFVSFMFVHKISYAFSFLIFLQIIKSNFLQTIKKIKIEYILVFLIIIVPWVLKNLITTSCLAYPILISCFSNPIFELQGLAQPQKAAWLTEIWAKGFIDHPNWKNLNLDEYATGFNWVSTWLGGHFIKILEILSPLLIVIVTFSFYIFFNKEKYLSRKLKKNQKYYLLWLGMFIGLVIWFYKAPVFRFGSFYIIGFVIISYISILNHFFSEKNSQDLIFFKSVFIFAICFFIIKNINRINNSNLTLFPKTINPEENLVSIQNHKNELKLTTVKDGLCYYTINICSHEIPKNIKITKFKGYYILME